MILEGVGYEVSPTNAMAFTPDKRLTYGRQDLPFYPKHVEETGKNILRIRDWDPIAKANAGERLVLRSPFRPTPGIFIDQSKNTAIDHVTVHYAEGMGLLPLVYTKSIDGLIFRKNTVKATSDFPPFHWNTHSFFLEKANNIRIENNDFQYGFDPQKDIRIKLSDPDAVKYTP